MRNHRGIDIAAGLAAAGAVVGLWLTLHPPTPSPDPHAPRAAGWGLAQEALAQRKADGEILVVTRDTTDFPQPALKILQQGFQRALRSQGAAFTVARALEVDPLRLVEVPSGDFLMLLRGAPTGSVVVSFMGPPLLSEAERHQLGAKKAAVVAFCPGSLPSQIDLRRLFEWRLLDAAIVNRPGIEPATTGHPAECFAASFQVLTATNVAAYYENRPAH